MLGIEPLSGETWGILLLLALSLMLVSEAYKHLRARPMARRVRTASG